MSGPLLLLGAVALAVPAYAGSGDWIDDGERLERAARQLTWSLAPGTLPPPVDGLDLTRRTAAAFALARYLGVSGSAAAQRTVASFLDDLARRSVPIGKSRIQVVLERAGVYNRWRLWGPLRRPLAWAGLLYTPDGEGRLVAAPGAAYERIYPGATALAVAAALEYRAATGDVRFDAVVKGWVGGLLALRVPGRGFRQSPAHLAESHYLNAQAWLALAGFAAAFPSERTRTEAILVALDAYVLERYTAAHNPQFYHWGTMAAAIRAEQTADPRLVGFLAALTAQMTAAERELLVDGGPDRRNSCHLVEGLATFVHLMDRRGLAAGDGLVARSRAWIETLMASNRRLQAVAAGPEAGDGAFLESIASTAARPDYTGHCLNALLLLRGFEPAVPTGMTAGAG